MKKNILALSAVFACISHASISDFFYDTVVFTKEIIHNQQEVGALFSCSSFTATELTRFFYNNATPDTDTYYVLEIGAGTGAVTQKIFNVLDAAQNHHKKYIFDVIEINENMCKHLIQKFYDRPSVQIRCRSILDWNPEYKYDYIVSTLPHTSLGTTLVKDILKKYQSLIKPGGMLSYIEYIGLARMKPYILRKKDREEFLEIRCLLKQMHKNNLHSSKMVMLNILPLYIHHLQF